MMDVDRDDEWLDPPEALKEAAMREALKAAYTVLRPVVSAYADETKDISPTEVMRAIVQALDAIQTSLASASAEFARKNRGKNVHAIYADEQHLLATATFAADSDIPIAEWHPYARGSQLLPIFAATTIVLRSMADFEEMADSSDDLEGLFRFSRARDLLKILPRLRENKRAKT